MTAAKGGYESPTTRNGYEFFEVSSAIQKAIRRGDEDVALYFAAELYNSGYAEYLWKRLKIIASEDIGLAEPLMPATIQALYQSFVDVKKKADGKHFPDRLFLVHAVLLLVRAQKSRLVDWALICAFDHANNEKIEIPDYAYDMHTRKGRKMNRTIDHFWNEASRLEPHDPHEREDEYREEAYRIFRKRAGCPLFDDKGGGENE